MPQDLNIQTVHVSSEVVFSGMQKWNDFKTSFIDTAGNFPGVT
jgi:dTDP-4-dehydrorhamnose reductase